MSEKNAVALRGFNHFRRTLDNEPAEEPEGCGQQAYAVALLSRWFPDLIKDVKSSLVVSAERLGAVARMVRAS
jgi:hypothetical protein